MGDCTPAVGSANTPLRRHRGRRQRRRLGGFQEGEEEGFFYGVVDATTLIGRFYHADGQLDFEQTLTR